MFLIKDSTCSCDSCSICATHSSADDESETEAIKIKKTKTLISNELKVSNFPKNDLHVGGNGSGGNIEFSQKNEISNYSSRSIITPILHPHHVVDVVPKPSTKHQSSSSLLEWNLLDQTIGIPISNGVRSNPLLPIIHHPLVSGNIPASMPFNLVENNSMGKKNSSFAQQSTSKKKENGEKKQTVKFSNTVTVAVVPDIQRRLDKSSE